MAYLSSATFVTFGALLLGLMLVAAGAYARRGGRLRSRQGAEVLAGCMMAIGLALMMGAAVLFARSFVAVF
jgi:hypothetical protein